MKFVTRSHAVTCTGCLEAVPAYSMLARWASWGACRSRNVPWMRHVPAGLYHPDCLVVAKRQARLRHEQAAALGILPVGQLAGRAAV